MESKSSSSSTTCTYLQSGRDVHWNHMYENLYQFYKKNGHVQISFSSQNMEYRKLAKWAASQRKRYAAKTLSEDQIELLERVKFRWQSKIDRYQEKWEERYNQLVQFKTKHGGSTTVPESYNAQLSTWVANQRKMNAANELKAERKAMLEKINFQWILQDGSKAKRVISSCTKFDQQWLEMYDKLQQYFSVHGDSNVPHDYQDDPNLGRWVANQRKTYHQRCWNRKLEMSAERIRKLEELNFQWFRGWHESRRSKDKNIPTSQMKVTEAKKRVRDENDYNVTEETVLEDQQSPSISKETMKKKKGRKRTRKDDLTQRQPPQMEEYLKKIDDTDTHHVDDTNQSILELMEQSSRGCSTLAIQQSETVEEAHATETTCCQLVGEKQILDLEEVQNIDNNNVNEHKKDEQQQQPMHRTDDACVQAYLRKIRRRSLGVGKCVRSVSALDWIEEV